MREAELAAATTAVPTSGAQEVLQDCRASGRRIVVVGDICSDAMETYLDLHGLRPMVEAVVGREQRPATSEWPGLDLARQAVKALGAEPSDCTLVSMSVLGMYAAAEAGIQAIGVVSGNGSRKHLAGTGGSVVVSTFAELAGALTAVPAADSYEPSP
ncbi:HAD family hydrolase [Microbispora rosea]|uniref:HAD family hydrolase n=1 Tax=Microbispora rosea TaxID=58117 RepID=UPI0036A0EDCC